MKKAIKDGAQVSVNKGYQSNNHGGRLTLTKFCENLSESAGWEITPDDIDHLWYSGFELSVPDMSYSVRFSPYYGGDTFFWWLPNADLTFIDYLDLVDNVDSLNAIMDYLNMNKINLSEIETSENEQA